MISYLTDSEGKFIPATQRPDGTWRKARRVKDGYVPQEEVPLYESKGKKFAERRIGAPPPGFTPFAIDPLKKDKQELGKTKSSANASNAIPNSSGNNKKQQKQPGMLTVPSAEASSSLTSKPTKTKTSNNNHKTTTANANSNHAVEELTNSLTGATIGATNDDSQDFAKKLKKLRKKLREIETIEEKLKSGELKKPEKDQLDKVKRKKEVLQEIERLVAMDATTARR